MLTRTDGKMTVCQFPCLQDNYGFLIRDGETGVVATVDTPDADAISAVLEQHGWSLDLVLNTHWHFDHTGGNQTLRDRHGATVIGPAAEGDKIPGRDRAVGDGDVVHVGSIPAQIISTPGHTLGHIVFYFADHDVAFVGDTLFSLGCGRLFEGTPEQMWSSIKALRDLPPQTTLYCAHEYTAANAAFVQSLGPATPPLAARFEEIAALRADGLPTVPMKLEDEKALNPFLRADDPSLAEAVGRAGATPEDVFAEIRSRKDSF